MSSDGDQPRHIALVGFMGCGKSTIGALLAEHRKSAFLDTDALIIAGAGGRSIPEIFTGEGEASFREREARAVASACAFGRPSVIATGGGVPLREENVNRLREACTVVWLAVRPDVIVARIGEDTGRPILAGAHTEAEMHARVLSLLADRAPHYQAAAHLIVDTSDRDPAAVVREIERKIQG